MSFMSVISPCCACGRIISCNPEIVPSLRVNGEREPLCPSCHARWNEIHRVSKGLAPIEALPGAWEGQEV